MSVLLATPAPGSSATPTPTGQQGSRSLDNLSSSQTAAIFGVAIVVLFVLALYCSFRVTRSEREAASAARAARQQAQTSADESRTTRTKEEKEERRKFIEENLFVVRWRMVVGRSDNHARTENANHTTPQTIRSRELTTNSGSDSDGSSCVEIRDEENQAFESVSRSIQDCCNEEAGGSVCCAICLSIFNDDDKVCISKGKECNHVFHKACMYDWLLRTDRCPLCREPFLSDVVAPTESEEGD